MNQEATPVIEGENPAFKRYPSDGSIDVNNLPSIPWTRDALGADTFRDLCIASGAGDFGTRQRNPSLDPRSFGLSRAKHLARINNATGPAALPYLQEGARLQETIDASLPPITGKPRRPGAPSLTPAATKFQEKGPKPSRWS